MGHVAWQGLYFRLRSVPQK